MALSPIAQASKRKSVVQQASEAYQSTNSTIMAAAGLAAVYLKHFERNYVRAKP